MSDGGILYFAERCDIFFSFFAGSYEEEKEEAVFGSKSACRLSKQGWDLRPQAEKPGLCL